MWHIDSTWSPEKQRRHKILGGVVAGGLLVIIFTAGLLVGRGTDQSVSAGKLIVNVKNKNERNLSQVDFQQFWQIWDKIQSRSVQRPISDTALFQGALQGMVAALNDPYSVYFTPEIAKQFQEEMEGSFSGIGAEVGAKDGRIVIVTPLAETPAEKAGLRAGDFILAVDGTNTSGLTVDETVKKIRGPAGTEVKLTIERPKEKKPLEFRIQRARIELKSVTYKLLPNKLALITLANFNDQTEGQLNSAIQDLLADGAQGVILDLRNNPGGYFDVAIRVASEWLDEGDVVVIEKGAATAEREEFRASGTHRLTVYPTAVLINEGSASAAEIVAGALHDQGRAELIGTQSFGKGSVQEYEPLADGGGLKLTIALWFTPNDNSINEVGVAPDIKIETPAPKEGESVLKKEWSTDPVIQRAVQYLRTNK